MIQHEKRVNMREFCIVLTLFLASTATGAAAFTCRLVVDGKTYVDGPCNYHPHVYEHGNDGSFDITSLSNGMFAYVFRNADGSADGWWPGPNGATHAHTSLGTLRRDGACWENSHASVCAWR
jgi:hypothetical protein